MMEKLSQMKNKFFKFLAKQPVASVSFQNPTLSPSTSFANKGCRSPAHMVSIIPMEARKRHRVGSFSAREPTSPKVSCMGQVKCKKKRNAKKEKWVGTKRSCESQKQNRKDFVLQDMTPASQLSPSLGTMKKFASGRGSLSDFDVTLEER